MLPPPDQSSAHGISGELGRELCPGGRASSAEPGSCPRGRYPPSLEAGISETEKLKAPPRLKEVGRFLQRRRLLQIYQECKWCL